MISVASVLLALVAVVVVHFALFRRSGRAAPTLPPRSAKRDYKRGSGKAIPCGNPATGAPLEERRAYTPEEVRAAYQRSKRAQEEWRNTSFAERKAVLMDVLDWTLANTDQVVEWSTSESGKTVNEAVCGEIMTTLEKIRWTVAEGEACLRPEARSVPLLLRLKKATVEYHPCGVIGVIVPWNYPFFNVVGAVVAAIFAGNGAVVKSSEWSSRCSEPIEDMFRSVLARRGHNPDLVQVITGYGETGAALVESGVEKVLFIGSPAVGKLVMRAASARLTPVILELGGKDPFIVFDDADFDHVVDVAIRGAFINCGQNCVAAERFYIQEGVYDRFVEEVGRRVAALRQGASSDGNCVDFGAITMPPQAEHVASLVANAVELGAKVVAGGKRFYEPPSGTIGEQSEKRGETGPPKGRCVYHQPTVLAGVTHDMRVANEETFGPLMCIIKFKGEEDLVRMVNSTEFGLACSIFTSDYKKADRVNAQIDTGMCTINDFAIVPVINSLPFGGVKESGFGHFNGVEGLRGFSRVKSVVTDRFGIKADTPKFLQYPVSEHAPNIMLQALHMIYGNGWVQSAGALFRMLKLIVSA